MKIKSGTDIIEIERIKNSIEELGEKFLKKIFTEKEIEYCESKGKQKYQHYAARFAAKEAAFKAVSQEFDNKFEPTWTDFEILNDEKGRPNISINIIDLNKIEDIDVSISHCKQYATAIVVALYK